MRIVMLTDDAQIDRRILQEAESLIGRGHEVILFADPLDGSPEHEIIGNVKVHRVPPGGAPRMQMVLASFHEKLVRRLNALSLWTQAVFARVLLKLEAKRGGVIRRFKADLLKPILAMLRLLLRLSLFCITRTATLSHKSTTYLGRASSRFGFRPPREATILREIRFHRADLVHAHDYPQMRLAVAAKDLLKIPAIYDAHELYPEINTLTPEQSKRIAKTERRLAPRFDGTITVNPYIAKEMAHRYAIPEPTVIVNAVDPPTGFEPGVHNRRFHQKLGLPPEERVLLFQGWMSATRGLATLIRGFAACEIGRLRLVLMGYGDERDNLQTLADELGITDRVHILDPVPQDELIWWTGSADAGAIPYPPVDLNNRLCSPNKLFEFVQARLPIIANDLPFLRDVVGGRGIGVLADLESPEGVAGAIHSMFEDKGGQTRFHAPLLAAAPELSWKAEQRHLFEVYRRVLGDAASPEPKLDAEPALA
ncbi:MAG: glycosyltransferase [Planctomycetota bacterium]